MKPYKREVSMDLPAVHRAVRMGRRVVQTFARTDDMPDEEIERLMLVASELLGNAVDHGGGQAAMTEEQLESNVRMRLRLVLDGGAWLLEVEDAGGGDCTKAEAAIAAARADDLEDERGRGLFLIRDMTDSFGVRSAAQGLVFFASRRFGES